MTQEHPTPPCRGRQHRLPDEVGRHTVGHESAQPYLRATGPEMKTMRPLASDDIPRRVRLQLTGGAEIHLAERRYAPGGPVPPGWIAEPVGRWHGRQAEVVYDARRHDIMFTHEVGGDVVGTLEADGWRRYASDTGRIAWTRDRVTATQAALTRLDEAAALGRGHPRPDLRPLERSPLPL